MKLWGLVAFFEEARRKRQFNKTLNSVSKAIALLQDGEYVVATFEGKEVKFVRKGDWFDAFVSHKDDVWEPIPILKPKPEVQHYNINGIPVTVGMDSNEWVEAMLDTYPSKSKRSEDPWPY